MKRHGWSGQGASHGVSLTHRAMGSAGGSQGSGSRQVYIGTFEVEANNMIEFILERTWLVTCHHIGILFNISRF
jgi:hypothetical protein